MKKSLRIIRQDPILAKNAKPKSDSKDHDKNSTLDTCTNNKSQFNIEERKISSTSINNPTETTFNSQMLCEYSQKETSATKSHNSRMNSIQENIPFNILQMSSHLQIEDIQRVIETKERKINSLEEDRTQLNDKIDKAVLFIKRTNYVPEILVEQHKKIDQMRDQLKHILRTIDKQKLISKHKLTQSICQEKLTDYQPSSRRKSEADDRKQLKVRSLSPTLPTQTLSKKEMYQMYEKPSICMNPNPKPKTKKDSRDHFKHFSVSLLKEQQRKGSQLSFDKLNLTRNTDEKSKEIRFFKKLALITASTPRQKTFDQKGLSLIANTEKQCAKKKKEKLREVSAKMGKQSVKGERREIKSLGNNYEELFGKFVSVIEGYKKTSKALYQKNKELEKRVKRLNKTEADEERF